MRIFIILLAVTGSVIGGLYLARMRPQVESPYLFEQMQVQHGDIAHVLRESGSLQSREPVLIKSRFDGTIKWIVEDQAWVEKGERIFVVSAEEVSTYVSERRGQMLTQRQELRLATLKRAHAAETERRKLERARRRVGLERTRFRIMTEVPKGGTALVEAHKALLPLEVSSRLARDAFEKAQDDYLAKQDALLTAQDEYEAARNQLLRAQTEIDGLKSETNRDPELISPDERKEYDTHMARLAELNAELAALKPTLIPLRNTLEAASTAAEAARGPMNSSRETLATADAKTRDLYVRLEIEKRGLPLALLQLDQKAAKLRLDEAKQKLADGESLGKSGAISEAQLVELRNAFETQERELAILQQQLAIESRPPPPEELAEAEAKLAKSEADLAAAERAVEQVLAQRDAEIAVIRAKMAEIIFEIDFAARNFVEIIESGIQYAERELNLLPPDAAERREELEAELAKSREQLAAAQANPPHIYLAPVSGIVRLKARRGEDRTARVGDKFDEEDVVAMVYPPANMEVVAKVNEVNVELVKPGMPATVHAPALEKTSFPAVIEQVAAIGLDKFAGNSRWYSSEQVRAGVTQFAMRVEIEGEHEGFRQGMTVAIAIEVDRREGVDWLPSGAISVVDGQPMVWRDQESPSPIAGYFFGDDHFVVTDGLAPGDSIWQRFERNL
ncbi:MAG: multidrug resistance efflux pump [Rhodothermales bacterium]|jgi:multidrug resistance efflux pump